MMSVVTSGTPHYMRRYFWRIGLCMSAYMAILITGLMLARDDALPLGAAIALAFATAAPICGVFWAIFRVLVECDDEYQRLLFVKQILLATAATLAICTVWQFLVVYDALAHGPKWFGVLWLAMFGLAAPVVRWRA